ncbi:hypothetical protein NL108_015744, partial [Boleophthalmus pectinirostris]
MSSPAPFLCPTCLHLSSTPVSLPCGHAFCLACLQTIDEGLDRHCCPQCRQEYHPNYYNNSYYYYFKEYCEDPGMSQFPLKYTPTVGKNAQGAGEEIAIRESHRFQNKTPLNDRENCSISTEKMAELKLKLMSKASDLTNKLENAEMVLKKEQECKRAVTMAHAKLRENALKLVGELTSFAQNYSKTIMELIEQELSPGEEMLHNKVEKASEVCKKIKKTMHEVDNLLKEKDANVFTSKIQSLESEIEGCKETKQPEENQELKFDLTKVCPELEQLSCEFRDKLGQVQRSLRSEFNPSEVTFDPETLHPNLILSEDLKMVTFSAKKQQYDPTPKRFTNFIQ